MSTSRRLQTRKVARSELLDEGDVVKRGFAGLTISEYPEPARAYNIVFWRLEPVWKQMETHMPLLVLVHGNLEGIMNSVWSSRVGIVPVQRSGPHQLEVVEEKVTFLTGETIAAITFSSDEILTERPAWCK